MDKELQKYHTFNKATIKLKDILPFIRGSGYSNYDECGRYIVLCPECEEWTHVRINAHSGFLDLLGDLSVEGIDAADDDILLWIKTDEYNWFDLEKAVKRE